MLREDFVEAVRIAERGAQSDPVLALNGGELFYSGRPGVPRDLERSARCYLAGLLQIDVVSELSSSSSQRSQMAKGLLMGVAEVVQRQPAVGATPDAIECMRKVEAKLHLSLIHI